MYSASLLSLEVKVKVWKVSGDTQLTSGIRRGYLGSTLLACRAVARPHIELEICIKSVSVE